MSEIIRSMSNELGIFPKIWEDLFGPSAKRIGKVLGSVTALALYQFKKLEFYVDVEDAIYVKNLNDFKKGLENIPEEELVSIPSEIAYPIIDRFQFIENKELASLFRNLLLSASSFKTASNAHPGFIHIIDRLSPDEASILSLYNNDNMIPIYVAHTTNHIENQLIKDFCGIMPSLNVMSDVRLIYPENITLSFQNLISLGLIEYTTLGENSGHTFDILEDYYLPKVLDLIKASKKEVHGNLMYLKLTSFGTLFLNVCIPCPKTTEYEVNKEL